VRARPAPPIPTPPSSSTARAATRSIIGTQSLINAGRSPTRVAGAAQRTIGWTLAKHALRSRPRTGRGGVGLFDGQPQAKCPADVCLSGGRPAISACAEGVALLAADTPSPRLYRFRRPATRRTTARVTLGGASATMPAAQLVQEIDNGPRPCAARGHRAQPTTRAVRAPT